MDPLNKHHGGNGDTPLGGVMLFSHKLVHTFMEHLLSE